VRGQRDTILILRVVWSKCVDGRKPGAVPGGPFFHRRGPARRDQAPPQADRHGGDRHRGGHLWCRRLGEHRRVRSRQGDVVSVDAIRQVVPGEIVAMDGKTLCPSHDRARRLAPPHRFYDDPPELPRGGPNLTRTCGWAVPPRDAERPRPDLQLSHNVYPDAKIPPEKAVNPLGGEI
jgi:hypothetical protein